MRYYITDLREASDTNITDAALAINGAALITNGFEIVGDNTVTGNHSELILKRIAAGQDFTGKKHIVEVAFLGANIHRVQGMPMLPLLRKFKDGVQVGSDVYITGHTLVQTTGTTRTYTYSNINYTLTNSDIVNGYYYQIVFRLHSTLGIPLHTTVSFTITSLTMETTQLREVHIPDKNLKKNYELESNQQFFRQTLDGKVKLLSEDYTYVMDKIDSVFDTEFHFYIFDTLQYFHGTFMATDCEVFEDDERLEISINSLDEYTDIMNGYDKEFDLIKINPTMTTVDIAKRPVLQIYIANEDVLTSIVGDSYWEESTSKTSANYTDIIEENKFAVDTILIVYDINEYVGTPVTDIRGLYSGYVSLPESSRDYITSYLYLTGESAGNYTRRIQVDSRYDHLSLDCVIRVFNGGTQIYAGTTGCNYFESLNFSGKQTMAESESVTAIGDIIIKTVSLRYALDKVKVGDDDTFLRSTLVGGDIAMENLNYLMAVGAQLGLGRISSTLSTTPSAYGTNGAVTPLYYQKPRAETGKSFFPIFRGSWGVDFSYWIAYDYTVSDEIEVAGSTTRTQNYCYTLAGVINAFLQQIAPDVTFADDSLTTTVSEYSQFFFNFVNPIATAWNNPEYLITPKSNVLHGINAKPAQKAPLTFNSLMNMIKNVFKCYWFIDNGKFRIEHIKYFNTGGYSGTPSVQVDLTTLSNERNAKYWDFNTSAYKFDKEALPERYEFNYMDNCTEAFSGSTIDVVSRYVQKGKVETVAISDFSADIDYILANVADISEDGFVLLSKFDGIVQFYPALIKGNEVNLQNGLLSFPFIHENYYTYDLPAKNVLINEATATVLGVLKKKEQELSFPYPTDPVTNQLIKTGIGNGKIIKMSINLASRIIEVTLAYDTE